MTQTMYYDECLGMIVVENRGEKVHRATLRVNGRIVQTGIIEHMGPFGEYVTPMIRWMPKDVLSRNNVGEAL